MKLTKHLISPFATLLTAWRLRRRLRRLHRAWRRSLKGRTRASYEQAWACSGVVADDDCIAEMARIMNLPTVYLYPDDRLSDILFNPYSDLSDVEALLLAERKLGVTIEIDREWEHRRLKELFPPKIAQPS